jgi:FkbM family methyltransferase
MMEWANYALVPKGRHLLVRVKTGIGQGLSLDIYPRWERSLWDGAYEIEVQSVMDRLLGPGVVFYDIGGGLGFYTCCAARRGARVFVFEPDETNARRLETHLTVNGLTKFVTVERRAVVSSSGTARVMRSSPKHSPGNAFVDSAATEVVPGVTLDDYCLLHPSPDVCKVDVEGSESLVLQGAEALFREHRTKFICEVHDEANAAFVEGWFARKRYSAVWLSSRSDFPRFLVASPDTDPHLGNR